ncbi:glycosyltransferase family 2 protein [Aquibacillus saliphilus]|uniref:glycosyltransferase family 2 protein n=1 Tax=Aquibacillus saliphilus TaxID=1909422 RepID=UPI001CEFDD37|nr:glycosyltransferase family 2 protein [Aquibacillus saliphilus]
MEEKISIIVPVYNVEKYLGKCVNSILKQSYQNFELILVDDGSQDNCGMICDRLAKNDKRIKVIHKSNGGLSSARNAGLKFATGKYISFIDSDDYIHPNMYEILYNYLQKYCSDIVICDFVRVLENVKHPYEKINVDQNVRNYSNIEALENIYTSLGTTFIVSWNKLYKRHLFFNLKFEEGRIHEDEFIAHKILYKSSKITYVQCELYYYVQREDGIINSPFNIKKIDAIYANLDRINFLNSINQIQLRRKAEFNFILLFFQLYFKVKKECDKPNYELKILRKKFRGILLFLIKNPYFKSKEKLMWIIFIIHPNLYENRINK